jgi:hypothetical protein
MGAATNQLCGLTRMTGRFAGGGESVRVFIDAGTWKLGGSSQQSGVAASARCLTWTSSSNLTYTAETIWAQGQAAQPLGNGNRACVFTLITGHYAGVGESVSIQTQGDAWRLTGSSAQLQVAARARCLSWP